MNLHLLPPLAGAALAAFAALLIQGCGAPQSGPVEVKWDRDPCERCRMMVSDPKHGAQVRGGPAGAPTAVYKFDDLGCAVIWLEGQPWRDDPRTEIWVTDHRTGAWIDARTAHYLLGGKSPMNYGAAAQALRADGSVGYPQAVARIHEVEARYNLHGGGDGHGH